MWLVSAGFLNIWWYQVKISMLAVLTACLCTFFNSAFRFYTVFRVTPHQFVYLITLVLFSTLYYQSGPLESRSHAVDRLQRWALWGPYLWENGCKRNKTANCFRKQQFRATKRIFIFSLFDYKYFMLYVKWWKEGFRIDLVKTSHYNSTTWEQHMWKAFPD